MMDADIRDEEIKDAIKSMKIKKSPGPDGLPVEFYRRFAKVLIPVMKKAFSHIFQEETLPPSWQEAMLMPILKPGKDHLTCSSYRPIALLNVDTKIFTAVLAHRLQLIIEHYV